MKRSTMLAKIIRHFQDRTYDLWYEKSYGTAWGLLIAGNGTIPNWAPFVYFPHAADDYDIKGWGCVHGFACAISDYHALTGKSVTVFGQQNRVHRTPTKGELDTLWALGKTSSLYPLYTDKE